MTTKCKKRFFRSNLNANMGGAGGLIKQKRIRDPDYWTKESDRFSGMNQIAINKLSYPFRYRIKQNKRAILGIIAMDYANRWIVELIVFSNLHKAICPKWKKD